MSTEEKQVVDRSVRWVQQAIRWAQVPDAEVIREILLSYSPLLVVGEDAANSAAGRLLASLTVRVMARAFPRMAVTVEGDAAFERDLRLLVAEVLGAPQRPLRPGAAIGIGAPRRPTPTFVGTMGWSAGTSTTPIPLGLRNAPAALLGASLCTGEVMKEVLRHAIPPEAWGRKTAVDLASGVGAWVNSYGLGDPASAGPPLPTHLEIGEALVVSAGALTNALLAAMLAEGRCHGRLRVWDRDRLDVSNVNRYLLVGAEIAALGLSKVEFLAALSTPALNISGVPLAYSPGHGSQRLVLVGADRLLARQAVAADRHGFVVNGASELTHVRVSTHRALGDACVGCINQGEDPSDLEPAGTVSFVSALTGALMLAQLYRFALGDREAWVSDLSPIALGRPAAATRQRIATIQGCPFCATTPAMLAG